MIKEWAALDFLHSLRVHRSESVLEEKARVNQSSIYSVAAAIIYMYQLSKTDLEVSEPRTQQ